MTNEPFSLTDKEIQEIAALEEVREMWGAENPVEMEEILLRSAYAVRFNFHSGCPGYVGDLFVIHGDALVEEPPVRLVRDADDKLAILR